MIKLKPGKTNKEDRLNFVKYWAAYVKSVPDKVWSRQQNILINGQIKNARQYPLSPQAYLKLKKEQCSRI